jgi:hypothetical protein
MKNYFLIVLLLLTYSVEGQNIKPYLSLSGGVTKNHLYNTQTFLTGNVFIGAQYHNENSEATTYAIPFAEFGTHLQATYKNVPQVLSLNSGIELHHNKFFAAGKVGCSYIFNIQVIDIHKIDSNTEIVLSPGAECSWLLSPSFTIAAGYNLPNVPLFIDATYTGKQMWYSFGIKAVIGE